MTDSIGASIMVNDRDGRLAMQKDLICCGDRDAFECCGDCGAFEFELLAVLVFSRLHKGQ